MKNPSTHTRFPRNLPALLAALLLAFSPASALAQTESDTLQEEEQRPQMGALFYSVEERRILEAIRQGVVEEEELEFTEDILPVVVVQEALPEEDEKPRERSQPLKVDAMIIRRSTGDASVWVSEGGKLVKFQVNPETGGRLGGKAMEARAGVLVEQGDISVDGVQGVDVFNNRRFRLRVGQILGTRGELDESYPIVIRKRAKGGEQ